ncbi:MAG: hypothetical protein ABJE47_15475 [bacterium]
MRRFLVVAVAIVVAAYAVACSDRRSGAVLPTEPGVQRTPSGPTTPGTCTTLASLIDLANSVFGPGSANANTAIGTLNSLDRTIRNGNFAEAQAQATTLITFIEQRANNLPAVHAQIQELIDHVRCYAGLSTEAVLVFPTDDPQVLTDATGHAGVSLQGATVTTPTLVTVSLLDPNGASPLDTKLDKYPGYVQISSSTQLTKPVVVGVCPSASVPSDVLARLRLGHQASGGFEITPPADASFLDCTGVAQSKTPGWLRALASLVLPRPAYAATLFAGGVGGVATEFSPFGPVDPELRFAGGVGGTATEFTRTPKPPTVAPRSAVAAPVPSRVSALNNPPCASVSAPAGAPLPPECRPVVTLTTHNGTIMQNVPVTWAVNLGGGSVAPQTLSSSACGPFGSGAATTTDVNGSASVCFTLGAPGANTVTATPGVGGDAPAGVSFAPPGFLFTATATRITPTVTATGQITVYDAQPHAGSGTCSNGLTPALSYDGNGSVPRNAGAYILTVTCGGGTQYTLVTATAPITISKAPATATAGSGTMTYGAPIPPLPCFVTGLLPADVNAVGCAPSAPATIVAGDNVVTPVVSPSANPPNYNLQLVAGVLTALYVKDGCFPAPLSAALPATTSFVAKGTSILVRCTLKGTQNVTVQNAGGNIIVQDLGTNGTTAGPIVLSRTNAFTLTTFYYGYNLDTSPAGFVGGHFYQVNATWTDGSTRVGYFYIRR